MTELTRILPNAHDVVTAHGPVVVVETRMDAAEVHGGVRLDRLRGPVGRGLADLAGADLAADQDLAEAVFLDVESTGLGAGAGIYAFLVGLARFSDGALVMRQYFLRAPEEEGAWARLVAQDLESCRLLVTYNGRSFDVPLLHTRFILQRRALPIGAVPHLDLMRPARRLWRHHLPSCALTSLEESLLDLHREGDVPGPEIPRIYNEYLSNGDATPLAPVVSHNALDVLSMVSLAIRIRDLIDDHRPTEPDHPAVWLGLGQCHEHLGDGERAEHAYVEACRDPPAEPRAVRDGAVRDGAVRDGAVRDEALRRLSGLVKRAHRWEEAEALWRDLVQTCHPDGLYPYENLAKLLEHREHRFADALEVVDVALLRLATGRVSCRRDPDRVARALDHRRRRLVRRSKG